MLLRRTNSCISPVGNSVYRSPERPRAAVLAGLALVTLTLGAGGVGVPRARAAQSCSRAYATNAGSDTISVIDGQTFAVVATARVSAGENACRGETLPNVLGLADIVAASDRPSAYVSSRGCAVFEMNTETNEVVGKIVLANEPVGPVALSPDSTILYVGGSRTVTSVDTATHTAIQQIAIGQVPIALALVPSGTVLYVLTADSVSVVATRTASVTSTLTVPESATAMALSPNGKSLYVASSPNSVSVIDTASGNVVATTVVGAGPSSLAVTPDGNQVFVTGAPLSVIETRTNAVAATIDLPNARGVAIAPDGSVAYVTNGADRVSIVNTTSNAVTATITVPNCGLDTDPTAPCIPTGIATGTQACESTPASSASSATAGNSGGCAVGSSRRSAQWMVAIVVPFVVFGRRAKQHFGARRKGAGGR
jgi:YVTN family beta-propeller protein